MSDLSKWGAGISDPSPGPDAGPEGASADQSDEQAFHDERCRAIATSTGQRCAGDTTGPMAREGLCSSHAGEDNVFTVDDDPAVLIGATTGRGPDDLADEVDGWDAITAVLEGVSIYRWERGESDR